MRLKKGLYVLASAMLMASLVTSCGKEPEEAKAPARTGEKILLRLRLEKGKFYRLRMTTDQRISQEIAGRKQEFPQTMAFGYTLAVDDVDAEGMASGTLTYDYVYFKQDQGGPMGLIEYDSSNPPDNVHPLAAGFAALAGQGFGVQISSMGRIKSVTGVDALLDRVLAQSLLPGGVETEAMRTSLKEQFGEQAMTEMMDKMMAYYPEKPVGVGDTWSQRVDLSKVLPMIVDTVYTLKSRKGGVATIQVASTVKPNPEGGPLTAGSIRMTYALSGAQTGTVEIDEPTGWPVGGALAQDFSGDVTIEGMPGSRKAVSLPMTIRATIRFEQPK